MSNQTTLSRLRSLVATARPKPTFARSFTSRPELGGA